MAGQSWDRWENAVISKLDDLHEAQKEHAEQMSDLKLQLAELKVKAGFWGAMSGLLSSILVGLALLLKK